MRSRWGDLPTAVSTVPRVRHASTDSLPLPSVLAEIGVAGGGGFARIEEAISSDRKQGGAAMTLGGMHVAIRRRTAEGTWRVARDVSSWDHPPPVESGTAT